MTYYMVMERPKGSKVWTPAYRGDNTVAYFAGKAFAERFVELRGIDGNDYHIVEMELPQ